MNILQPLISRPRVNRSYFVVMQDFGRTGFEAIVHPEDTRREIIESIAQGQYKNIQFIHHVDGDGLVDDVTYELVDAAEEFARDGS